MKSFDYKNKILTRNNDQTKYDNRNKNNGQYAGHNNSTPTYGKQNNNFKKVNILATRLSQDNTESNIEASVEDDHPMESFDGSDLEEYAAELRKFKKDCKYRLTVVMNKKFEHPILEHNPLALLSLILIEN